MLHVGRQALADRRAADLAVPLRVVDVAVAAVEHGEEPGHLLIGQTEDRVRNELVRRAAAPQPVPAAQLGQGIWPRPAAGGYARGATVGLGDAQSHCRRRALDLWQDARAIAEAEARRPLREVAIRDQGGE